MCRIAAECGRVEFHEMLNTVRSNELACADCCSCPACLFPDEGTRSKVTLASDNYPGPCVHREASSARAVPITNPLNNDLMIMRGREKTQTRVL